jgi:hypothetical protein
VPQSFGYIPKNGIAGSNDSSMFSFLRSLQIFSRVVVVVYMPLAGVFCLFFIFWNIVASNILRLPEVQILAHRTVSLPELGDSQSVDKGNKHCANHQPPSTGQQPPTIDHRTLTDLRIQREVPTNHSDELVLSVLRADTQSLQASDCIPPSLLSFWPHN